MKHLKGERKIHLIRSSEFSFHTPWDYLQHPIFGNHWPSKEERRLNKNTCHERSGFCQLYSLQINKEFKETEPLPKKPAAALLPKIHLTLQCYYKFILSGGENALVYTGFVFSGFSLGWGWGHRLSPAPVTVALHQPFLRRFCLCLNAECHPSLSPDLSLPNWTPLGSVPAQSWFTYW